MTAVTTTPARPRAASGAAGAAQASMFDQSPDVPGLLAMTCPLDAGAILAEVERSLYRALIRRGQTWHLRTCLASGVNSRPVACSDPCIRTQIGLAWAGIWRERQATRPPGRAGRDRR